MFNKPQDAYSRTATIIRPSFGTVQVVRFVELLNAPVQHLLGPGGLQRMSPTERQHHLLFGTPMYTTRQAAARSRRQFLVLMSTVVFGTGCLLGYLALLGTYRDEWLNVFRSRFGQAVANGCLMALAFPAIGFFLFTITMADRWARQFAIVCPHCQAGLSRQTARVLATRCCSNCHQQIIEGRRIHSAEVYRRYTQIRQRHWFVYWLWTRPILGSVMLIDRWLLQNITSDNIQVLWMSGLLGLTSAGWSFIRTYDRSYLLPLIAMIIVLLLAVVVPSAW